MPSTDDLARAGADAANRPVPLGPSIADLEVEAGRRRSRRRRTIGSVAAGVVLVAAVPLAAAQFGADDEPPSLFTAAAQTDDAEGVVDESSPTTTIGPTTTTTEVNDSDVEPEAAPDGAHSRSWFFGGDGDFHLELGDEAFSIRTIHGPEAAAAAAEAEAAATETREVEGTTVWVTTDGDVTTAAALVEDDLFVEVRGASDRIDALLDTVVSGMPFSGPTFDLDELLPRSDERFPHELFPDGLENFDPENFDPKDFFPDDFVFPDEFEFPDAGAFPRLEELLPPEVLERLEERGFGEGFFFQFPPCEPEDHDEEVGLSST